MTALVIEAPTELPIAVRPMGSADRAFVRETTLKVRNHQMGEKQLPWRLAQRAHGPDVDAALEGTALIAESGGVILGFAVAKADVLEMLYVKRDFRGEGFGYRLWVDAGRPAYARSPTPSFRHWMRRNKLELETTR
jgi:GNAT superfamily N-acetyltransferase